MQQRVVIIHLHTTPMHKHLGLEDSLLPSLTLGFHRGMGTCFFLGLACSHSVRVWEAMFLCKIQLELLDFPRLSTKIATPVGMVAGEPCSGLCSFSQQKNSLFHQVTFGPGSNSVLEFWKAVCKTKTQGRSFLSCQVASVCSVRALCLRVETIN